MGVAIFDLYGALGSIGESPLLREVSKWAGINHGGSGEVETGRIVKSCGMFRLHEPS